MYAFIMSIQPKVICCPHIRVTYNLYSVDYENNSSTRRNTLPHATSSILEMQRGCGEGAIYNIEPCIADICHIICLLHFIYFIFTSLFFTYSLIYFTLLLLYLTLLRHIFIYFCNIQISVILRYMSPSRARSSFYNVYT